MEEWTQNKFRQYSDKYKLKNIGGREPINQDWVILCEPKKANLQADLRQIYEYLPTQFGYGGDNKTIRRKLLALGLECF